MSYKNMNKAKKYDDKRIKSLLNPRLKKEKTIRRVFVSDEFKQKFNINSPENIFEIEVDQRVMDKEHERTIDSSIKILEEIKERV